MYLYDVNCFLFVIGTTAKKQSFIIYIQVLLKVVILPNFLNKKNRQKYEHVAKCLKNIPTYIKYM